MGYDASFVMLMSCAPALVKLHTTLLPFIYIIYIYTFELYIGLFLCTRVRIV